MRAISQHVRIVLCVFSVVLCLGWTATANADLLAHWTFDETSGTTAVDSTGNGHDGTIIGPVTLGVAGAVGTAYNFPLQTATPHSHIDVADYSGLSALPAASLTAWFMMPTAKTGNWLIMHTGNYSYVVGVGAGSSNLMRAIRFGQNADWGIPTSSIVSADWQQLTFSYTQGGATNMYVNGVLEKTVSNSVAMGVANSLYLGGGWWGQSYGDPLDDLGIWDQALTETEVKAIYNTPQVAGLQVTGLYNLGAMEQLFDLYAAGTGSVAIGGETWQYETGLTGHVAGDAWTDGGLYYVQLGGDGTGVATIPEPGTLALLATGLIGLLCYAWRKRK